MRTWLIRGAWFAAASMVLGAIGYSSTHVVNQSETGVVMAFGAVDRVVPPGIHLTLPWPFGGLRRVDTNSVDRIPIGFRFIDEANRLPPTEDMVQWLTGDTNIVELQAVVLYSIANPREFLFNVVDPGEPGLQGVVENQRFVVRRAAEAVLTRRIATLPIDELLTDGKIELQIGAVAEIQEQLDRIGAGIRISAVQVVSANPPQTVIDDFNDVQTGRSNKERRISEADGYARDVLPKARGRANSLQEEAETYRAESLGKAKSSTKNFERLRAEVQVNRDLVFQRIWVESMQRVLSKVKLVVVPPGDDAPPFRLFVEMRK